jgi:transposase
MEKTIGIDVSKANLDLHVLDSKRDLQFDNNADGIKKCSKLCMEVKPELVVLEATGGYEYQAAAHLSAKGLPVAVVNPRRVRDFAKALGFLAKTDKIDARVIALYAANCKPMAQGVISDNSRKLKALTARRKQLLDMKTAENNRMEHAIDNVISRSLKRLINMIDSEIEKVNKQISKHIDSMPELQEKAETLKSVPGIGEVTASMLMTSIPAAANCFAVPPVLMILTSMSTSFFANSTTPVLSETLMRAVLILTSILK